MEDAPHRRAPFLSVEDEGAGGEQVMQMDRSALRAEGAEVSRPPSMAVTVEIGTGTRCILFSVFSPFRQVIGAALRER